MIFGTAAKLNKDGQSFCLVTLIASKGSAPQDPGAKCIVTKNGLAEGTVGGGKVEARAIEFCLEILNRAQAQAPITKVWNLQTDIGMTCGGEVTYLFEYFPAKNWPIVIFGAGHVANSLVQLLATLDCQVTCIDPRSEWTGRLPQNISNLEIICHPNPKDLIASFSEQSYFLSITQGHTHDTPILAEIGRLYPNPSYVGVIGSVAKGNRIKNELKELGTPLSFIEKLRIPIGLPIGSNQPSEIAISIAAQLLQVRDQLSSMRE